MTDQEAYEVAVEDFKRKWASDHYEEVAYVMEVWLDPYKARLVKAWVDQHLHFSNVVTSRAEGIHSLIKLYINTSQADLFEAWKSIKLALLNQIANLVNTQQEQQVRTPIDLSGSLFANIQGWVSHEALRKVKDQQQLLSRPDHPRCTTLFTKSHGLPCSHSIEQKIAQDQPLLLTDFHPHWYLQREQPSEDFLLEPLRVNDRLEPRSQRSKQGTRRVPSTFEAVEAQIQPRTPPICSRCHQSGHKLTSKICPFRFEALRSANTAHSSTIGPTASADPCPTALTEVSQIVPSYPSPKVSSAVVNVSPPSPTRGPHDPITIFDHYKTARGAWYSSLPKGGLKTNQQYRKAMNLPLRYSKTEFDWCQDYKQMGKQRITRSGRRNWSREEMMSYLDWDKAETERVEEAVRVELGDHPVSHHRGPQAVWEACERDLQRDH